MPTQTMAAMTEGSTIFSEDIQMDQHLQPKRKIIIIEDNKESQQIVMSALENMNFQFLWAHDGYEAVESMLNTSRLDLIILDWHMPGLEGGEVLRCLERSLLRDPFLELDWTQKPVPYVIYSSSDKESLNIPAALHFVNVGFWKKPMALSEIRESVKDIFDRYKWDETDETAN